MPDNATVCFKLAISKIFNFIKKCRRIELFQAEMAEKEKCQTLFHRPGGKIMGSIILVLIITNPWCVQSVLLLSDL